VDATKRLVNGSHACRTAVAYIALGGLDQPQGMLGFSYCGQMSEFPDPKSGYLNALSEKFQQWI
jgi:hypothetical protein